LEDWLWLLACKVSQGVGQHLMRLVHGEILDSTSLSAARLIIVDADNRPEVLRFYRAHGYQDSLWAEQQGRKLVGALTARRTQSSWSETSSPDSRLQPWRL
jgi:ribosomal protein S18 acetylase RimI-like enzyme